MSLARASLALTVSVCLGACRSREPQPAVAAPPAADAAATPFAKLVPPAGPSPRDEPRADLRIGDRRLDEHDHDHPDELEPEGHAVIECPLADRLDLEGALDLAARKYESGDYELALGCADRAVRISPRNVEAHHNRGLALAALERWDQARAAFTHALAIDPDDPETLAGAADLYINRVPPERAYTELGLEYARRGSLRVGGRRDDKELAVRLALLEGQALDDLGLTDEALARVEVAVALDGRSFDARYERAVVLFHLCKLDLARQALLDLIGRAPDDAFVIYHLAMVLEREGRQGDADKLFARAHKLAADKFPDPAGMISPEDFQALVDAAKAQLPPRLKQAVEGVTIEVADLPAIDDLLAVDPPFAPTILGLYRGAPLGEKLLPGDEDRSIVLYRRNLARATSSRAELERQVRITLWHEIGHLRGADEDDLRARGLE